MSQRIPWSLRDLPLLTSATAAVAAFRLLLWVLPLRRLRHWVDGVPLSACRNAVEPIRIGQAVTSAAHRIPRADCLPRALATQYLLKRRGINSKFCLGVRNDTGEFAAHAWITCNGQIVVGEVAGQEFAELKRAG